MPIASGFGLNIPAGIRIAHSVGMTYEVTVASRDTAYGNREATAKFNISGPNYVVRITNLKLAMPQIAVDVAGTSTPFDLTAIDAPFDSLELSLDPDRNRVMVEAGTYDSETPELAMAINNSCYAGSAGER